MKTAVILFNLGGPDRQAEVQPFLFNLFNDPAIIRVPQPLRFLLAQLIAYRRAKIARPIYAKLGGGSPILVNTRAQAAALESVLHRAGEPDAKCFVAMRYWHPFADGVAAEVKEFAPDKIILLPLYPQFSTTTTTSSLTSWHRAARSTDLHADTKIICCYPDEPGFIRALTALTRAAYAKATSHGKPRVLFSAHGLPQKIVDAGDPYVAHCARTVEALVKELAIDKLNYVLCYQSRVGPLAWIKPTTDDEIRRAGRDKVPVVIVPIAFVSEHSETLVEIDIEYRRLAAEAGVPYFAYAGTVATAPDFITGLAALVRKALAAQTDCVSGTGARLCPAEFPDCPHAV